MGGRIRKLKTENFELLSESFKYSPGNELAVGRQSRRYASMFRDLFRSISVVKRREFIHSFCLNNDFPEQTGQLLHHIHRCEY